VQAEAGEDLEALPLVVRQAHHERDPRGAQQERDKDRLTVNGSKGRTLATSGVYV
jgi:hypothetical protein